MKPARAITELVERRLQRVAEPVRDALAYISTLPNRLPRLPVDALTRLVMLAVGLSLLSTYALLTWFLPRRRPAPIEAVEPPVEAGKRVVHILWDVENCCLYVLRHAAVAFAANCLRNCPRRSSSH